MRWIRSVFVFKGTDLGRSPSGVRCLVSLRLAGTLSGPLNSVFGIRFSRCPASLRRGCRVKRRGCILRAPPGPRKPLSAPPHFLHKRARRGADQAGRPPPPLRARAPRGPVSRRGDRGQCRAAESSPQRSISISLYILRSRRAPLRRIGPERLRKDFGVQAVRRPLAR